MRVSNLVTNERAQLAPFNSGNATIGLTAGTAGNYDFNRDGKYVYDFSPAFSPTATLKTAMPVIDAGQKMFISAPESTKTLLDVLRSGVIISNDLRTPYSQQANLGIQREMPGGVVLDANFVYSRSVHEFTRDIDAANLFPGNGPKIILGDFLAPTAQITVIRSDGFSQYKAFTVRADKRFANRYQFTASYALARLNTTSPDGLGLGAGALVNRDQKANYGPGALDRTHKLTLNGIVDLPKGFRASLIGLQQRPAGNGDRRLSRPARRRRAPCPRACPQPRRTRTGARAPAPARGARPATRASAGPSARAAPAGARSR